MDMKNEPNTHSGRRPSTSIVLLLTFVLHGAALGAQEAPEVAAAETAASAEARAAYAEGRTLWSTRKASDLQASLIPLQRAVELAPEWATAHSGLADSLALLGLYGARPANETLPLAGAAARRALELDAALGQAHASLGLTQYLYEHDYDNAERSFRKALELDPGLASARHWMAMMFSAQERHGEALELIDTAVEQAPSSALLCNKRGTILRNADLLTRARTQLIDCRERHGPSSLNLRETASIDLLEERWADARNRLLQAQQMAPTDGRTLALLGYTAIRAGEDDLAEEVRETLGELSAERYLPVSTLLGLYVGAGEVDRAFRTLREALENREAGIVYIATRPELLPLRGDPRFQTALDSLGLGRK